VHAICVHLENESIDPQRYSCNKLGEKKWQRKVVIFFNVLPTISDSHVLSRLSFSNLLHGRACYLRAVENTTFASQKLKLHQLEKAILQRKVVIFFYISFYLG
jgi:hypothetical protein